MLLVDATGGHGDRFKRIDAALQDLLYGEDTAVMINRTVGNGVVTYTEGKLKLASEAAKFQFPVTRISLGAIPHHCAEFVKDAALKNGGIVILDEAEQLDRIEGAAEALRALESPYIKFVYISLVPEIQGLLNRFVAAVA